MTTRSSLLRRCGRRRLRDRSRPGEPGPARARTADALRRRARSRGSDRPRRAPGPQPTRPARRGGLRRAHPRERGRAPSARGWPGARRAPARAQSRPAGRARHGRRQARAPDHVRPRRTRTKSASARARARCPRECAAACSSGPRGVAAGDPARTLLHRRRTRRATAMRAVRRNLYRLPGSGRGARLRARAHARARPSPAAAAATTLALQPDHAPAPPRDARARNLGALAPPRRAAPRPRARSSTRPPTPTSGAHRRRSGSTAPLARAGPPRGGSRADGIPAALPTRPRRPPRTQRPCQAGTRASSEREGRGDAAGTSLPRQVSQPRGPVYCRHRSPCSARSRSHQRNRAGAGSGPRPSSCSPTSLSTPTGRPPTSSSPGSGPRIDDENARMRLWRSASEARGQLGEVIIRSGERYQLDRQTVAIDLDRFEALLAAADGEAADRQALLEQALALVRGQPLAGSDYPWATGEVRRLAPPSSTDCKSSATSASTPATPAARSPPPSRRSPSTL